MEPHLALLAVGGLFSGLAAGVFFAFTALVIPGLLDLDKLGALRGFQAIDGRLQRGASSIDWQPVFGVVLFAAGPILILAAIVGWPELSDQGRGLAIGAAAAYNLGFWLPTFGTIVPFNVRVSETDLATLAAPQVEALHRDFRRNWVGWNLVRTATSTLSLALLLAALVTR